MAEPCSRGRQDLAAWAAAVGTAERVPAEATEAEHAQEAVVAAVEHAPREGAAAVPAEAPTRAAAAVRVLRGARALPPERGQAAGEVTTNRLRRHARILQALVRQGERPPG